MMLNHLHEINSYATHLRPKASVSSLKPDLISTKISSMKSTPEVERWCKTKHIISQSLDFNTRKFINHSHARWKSGLDHPWRGTSWTFTSFTLSLPCLLFPLLDFTADHTCLSLEPTLLILAAMDDVSVPSQCVYKSFCVSNTSHSFLSKCQPLLLPWPLY